MQQAILGFENMRLTALECKGANYCGDTVTIVFDGFINFFVSIYREKGTFEAIGYCYKNVLKKVKK